VRARLARASAAIPWEPPSGRLTQRQGSTTMKEYRAIILSEPEVINAMVAYCQVRSWKIPRGTVTGVRFRSNGGLEATMHVESDDGADNQIRFTTSDLTALVVKYCLDRKTRLPAKVSKWVELVDDHLSLMLEVSSGTAPAAEATPRSPTPPAP